MLEWVWICLKLFCSSYSFLLHVPKITAVAMNSYIPVPIWDNNGTSELLYAKWNFLVWWSLIIVLKRWCFYLPHIPNISISMYLSSSFIISFFQQKEVTTIGKNIELETKRWSEMLNIPKKRFANTLTYEPYFLTWTETP